MIDDSAEPFTARPHSLRLGSDEVIFQYTNLQGKFDSRCSRETDGPVDIRHTIWQRSTGVRLASNDYAAR